ncbi:MAG: response regulator [candidate division KSB1 bacterium]|nr:response regulator [candidate division KSB1 bacterium]MDZ7300845.1 response regulator [candidate division KSB1 bacterium]MDZ7309884.1 response regulator [candidate division KSB1 bacterium]
MNRIVMLNEDLESQMRMYLALCPRYRIEIAENELALMRLLRRKKPNLLLLDAHYSRFNHNGKSIAKLVEKIKRKYNHLPVLAIVNGEDERLAELLTQRGADGWVTRRVQIDDLLQRVDGLLQPVPSFLESRYEQSQAVMV